MLFDLSGLLPEWEGPVQDGPGLGESGPGRERTHTAIRVMYTYTETGGLVYIR